MLVAKFSKFVANLVAEIFFLIFAMNGDQNTFNVKTLSTWEAVRSYTAVL